MHPKAAGSWAHAEMHLETRGSLLQLSPLRLCGLDTGLDIFCLLCLFIIQLQLQVEILVPNPGV